MLFSEQTPSDMGLVDLHALEPINDHEGLGIAVVLGDPAAMSETENGPLIRMHSRCLYGEVLGADDCECGPQLIAARQQIAAEEEGILFYLEQEGRGAGLLTKARGYALAQKEGLDTAQAYEQMGVPFDQRQYGHCARFLLNSSIEKVRLLTNNPRKISGLTEVGIAVARTQLLVGVNETNKAYLAVKRDKAGHLLPKDL